VLLKVGAGLSSNAAAREPGCAPSTAVLHRSAVWPPGTNEKRYLAKRFYTGRRLLLVA